MQLKSQNSGCLEDVCAQKSNIDSNSSTRKWREKKMEKGKGEREKERKRARGGSMRENEDERGCSEFARRSTRISHRTLSQRANRPGSQLASQLVNQPLSRHQPGPKFRLYIGFPSQTSMEVYHRSRYCNDLLYFSFITLIFYSRNVVSIIVPSFLFLFFPFSSIFSISSSCFFLPFNPQLTDFFLDTVSQSDRKSVV